MTYENEIFYRKKHHNMSNTNSDDAVERYVKQKLLAPSAATNHLMQH